MKKAITILLLLFVFGSMSAQIPVFSATTNWRVADGNNTWVGTALQNKTYLAAGTLSKVDDTNITLTLGGTPASSLFNSVSITAGWTGTLAATRGGTGLGSLGSSKQILRTNSAGTALEYSSTQSIGTGLAVGTTSDPVASAVLDIVSTTKGFGLPIMTSAQKEAIASPRQGLEVFDTDLDGKCVYDGTKWFRLSQESTPTIAVGAGAGTGATVSVVGNDIEGVITLTGGTGATASATVFTLTFFDSYTSAPHGVILVPADTDAANLSSTRAPAFDTISTTTFTMINGSGNGITNAVVYTYAYRVIQ